MNAKYLYLNSRDEFYRVDISKIVYFEAEGNYTNFFLANSLKGIVGTNLAKVEQILSDSLKEDASIFARIGKKYIINLTYVYHIEVLRQRLVLSDGEVFNYQLPVSKEALKKLRDLYVQAIKGKCRVSELIKKSAANAED